MRDENEKSVMDLTLEAAIIEGQTVEPDGTLLAKVPDGSISRASKTHVDDRGTVTEMFDKRWNFHPDPIDFVYTYTMLPGRVKGWGLHQLHEDRYFLVKGRMMIVCYDVRPESPTCGQVSKIILDEMNPRIVTIPKFVWHANVNIGEDELRVVNFPTMPYDHANPDKMRLPLDTDLIPYDFAPGLYGW